MIWEKCLPALPLLLRLANISIGFSFFHVKETPLGVLITGIDNDDDGDDDDDGK